MAANFVLLGSAGTQAQQNIDDVYFGNGITVSTSQLVGMPVSRAPVVSVLNVGVSAGQSIFASSVIEPARCSWWIVTERNRPATCGGEDTRRGAIPSWLHIGRDGDRGRG
jgi:hypothetical protein